LDGLKKGGETFGCETVSGWVVGGWTFGGHSGPLNTSVGEGWERGMGKCFVFSLI
jgi:hypothetical protein